MFFLLIFIFAFSHSIVADQIPMCKSVSQSGVFSNASDISSTAIAKFSFDMSSKFNNNNQSLPNTVIITNFSFTNFQADNNLTFQNITFTFFGNPHKIIHCPSISTNNCTFQFPNGEIIYYFTYGYGGSQKVVMGPNLYLNDGIFFDGKTMELWDPTKNYTCNNYASTNDGIHLEAAFCCLSFENVKIPDSNIDHCQSFESTTTISDPSAEKPVSIIANYFVSSNKSLQVNVALLSSPDPAYIYYVYVGYPFVSFINGSSITQNTSFSLDLINEKQYEILFDYNPSADDSGDGIFKYGGVNLGEIIIRNGLFFKNVNQPYSSANACSTKVATVPFTNATYNSSFCCTSFMSQATTATPISPTGTPNKINSLEVNFVLLMISVFFWYS